MGRKRIWQSEAERKQAYRQSLGLTPRSELNANRKQNKRDQWLERWRSRPFIAIDGEGADDDTGTHHYTMFSASVYEQHYTLQGPSLGTQECFDFLLRLHSTYPTAIFTGFSLNYDINMMLRDVPLENLTQLNKDGFTLWFPYGISWIPGKICRISFYERGKKKPRQTITLYDVFGFFQASFISVLHKWNIGTPEEQQAIYQMKKQRGKFNETDNKEIQDYNVLECKLLVQLMNTLRTALDTAGLYLKSWHGAGAVGGELLSKYGIDKHIERYDELEHIFLTAYFGGRFQTCLLGEHYNVYTHDVRSAYPSAFLHQCSLSGGEWIHCSGENYNSLSTEQKNYSVWSVSWNIDPKTPICPFPHRHKRRISYPPSGEGWYWHPEVVAAGTYYGKSIEIREGYVFIPNDDCKPFTFLQETYEERKRLKQLGDDAEKVLKLGTNSVYGKTAQGMTRNRRPRFQSYIWAGYCTSLTRARIFELAMRRPESVIAFATDGVFASERLTRPDEETDGLGQWDVDKLDYLLWAQSGVYLAVHEGNERISKRLSRKTRGLGRSEINFAKLRKDYRKSKHLGRVTQTVTIRRFFGLQYCLHTNNMKLWRKWSEIQKTVTLEPNNDCITDKRRNSRVRLYQCSYEGYPSEPYQIKGSKRDKDDEELEDLYLEADQPLWGDS